MTLKTNTNICVSYDGPNKHQYLNLVWLSQQTPVFMYLLLPPNTKKTQIFVFRMSTYTRICVLYDPHNKHQYLSLNSINRFISIVKVICHASTATLYNSQEYESS